MIRRLEDEILKKWQKADSRELGVYIGHEKSSLEPKEKADRSIRLNELQAVGKPVHHERNCTCYEEKRVRQKSLYSKIVTHPPDEAGRLTQTFTL